VAVQAFVQSKRLRRIGVLAVVVVFTVIVGAFWMSRPLPPPRVLQITQLTRDATPKAGVLTDGLRIYIEETTGDGNKHILMQASATGGDTSPLNIPFSSFYLSDISPDASELLIVNSPTLESGPEEAWFVPLPSGTPRGAGTVGSKPVWSPNGESIAYVKGRDILLADLKGESSKKAISLPGEPWFLRFSPDGTRLRFVVDGSLWEAQIDGRNLHPLLSGWHEKEQKCCGLWSSDGRYFLFVSSDGTNSQIYALPEPHWPFHRNPRPQQLTSGPMMFPFGVPTPDGKKILADGYLPRAELVRYDDHAKDFVPFLSGISADLADFSRDGKWVAYVSVPDNTLWRSRVDGTERLQLTSPPVIPWLPHWSPDGTQIVYTDRRPSHWKSMLISVNGGNPTEMYPESQFQVDANYSPDGKQIVFGRFPFTEDKPDVFDIRILDINSKQVRIVPGSQNLYSPRWSADGKYLACVTIDNRKFVLYDFKTQKWSDWTSGFGSAVGMTFSRDSKYLYFDVTSGEHPGYYRVMVGQTHPEFLFDLSKLHRSWWSGLTPDNIPIFSRDISTDEIYALDVELP
jgi:Tol biopolymer transport system component